MSWGKRTLFYVSRAAVKVPFSAAHAYKPQWSSPPAANITNSSGEKQNSSKKPRVSCENHKHLRFSMQKAKPLFYFIFAFRR